MLLLITDTSGRNGIVAVARALQAGKQDQIQILESVPLAGGTFSAQLVPQIAALLEKHGLSKSQIDAFVVVSGPGSFTGLRVGLAAIKALAEILQKPIVPVSFLEVVARAARIDGRIIALLDAGRGQLYSGEYEISGARAQLIQEHLIAREALPDLSRAVAISTPDATLAGLSREAGLRTFELKAIPPEMIALLGWSKLCDGEIASPEQLDANYVRRSDQIFGTPSSATPQPSKIRTATPDDIPLLLQLERESTTAAHWTLQQYTDLFRDGAAASRLVLLVEKDDVLLGFIVAHHIASEWELENIVVSSNERRKGIGARLMQGLMDALGHSASEFLFLEVRESNHSARRFYQKTGFQQAGVRKAYYRDPPEDAILYRLQLRKLM